MAEPDPTFRRVIEAARAGARVWEHVLPEADRRLHTEPLVAAIATATARLLEDDLRQHRVTPDEIDTVRWAARRGAALALVIAERPELITGEETGRRRPPADVIAERIAPVVRPDLTLSQIREVAAAVLTALALAGWEVTWRADRFASLRDDGRKLRIPTRGRCLTCYGHVSRPIDNRGTEVIVGAWQHVDSSAPHRDDAITTVDAP